MKILFNVVNVYGSFRFRPVRLQILTLVIT